jgi:hypothetical protein
MTGTGDFATGEKYGFVGLREAMTKAWMRFYSILYYYHEVDASYNSAVRSEIAANNDTVKLSAIRGAYSK